MRKHMIVLLIYTYNPDVFKARVNRHLLDTWTAFGLELPPLQKTIIEELSWPLKIVFLNDYLDSKSKKVDVSVLRTVGMQSLIQAKGPGSIVRQGEGDPEHIEVQVPPEVMPEGAHEAPHGHEASKPPEADDENMQIKLFRLMYETVRDSDLKVKRAELVKRSYPKSAELEIGYLMGDVMQKLTLMSDIASTLKRLYHVWKPMEHVNAYEQVANRAIEINHLIEMIRAAKKKNNQQTTNKVNVNATRT